jgi:hypothetical protein
MEAMGSDFKVGFFTINESTIIHSVEEKNHPQHKTNLLLILEPRDMVFIVMISLQKRTICDSKIKGHFHRKFQKQKYQKTSCLKAHLWRKSQIGS